MNKGGIQAEVEGHRFQPLYHTCYENKLTNLSSWIKLKEISSFVFVISGHMGKIL